MLDRFNAIFSANMHFYLDKEKFMSQMETRLDCPPSSLQTKVIAFTYVIFLPQRAFGVIFIFESGRRCVWFLKLHRDSTVVRSGKSQEKPLGGPLISRQMLPSNETCELDGRQWEGKT